MKQDRSPTGFGEWHGHLARGLEGREPGNESPTWARRPWHCDHTGETPVPLQPVKDRSYGVCCHRGELAEASRMVAYRDPAGEFNDAMAEIVSLLAAGRADAALARMDELPEPEQKRIDVLSLRCEILLALGAWRRAAGIAELLAKSEPRNPAHWVHWAYAARRHVSLVNAEKILREARDLHPESGVIAFNLACYCAQSGRLEEALKLLRRAIELDESFAKLGRSDPDLEPLRASLPKGHGL